MAANRTETVSTPAQLRAKATYRAKQLSFRTAQAKRVEETALYAAPVSGIV